MHLIDQLKDTAENNESIFRQQLAKEDLGRFDRLSTLAVSSDGLESFKKDGLYIGWTQSDMRTHDLRDKILILLEAYFAATKKPEDKQCDDKLLDAWNAFHVERLEKLIHCL